MAAIVMVIICAAHAMESLLFLWQAGLPDGLGHRLALLAVRGALLVSMSLVSLLLLRARARR